MMTSRKYSKGTELLTSVTTIIWTLRWQKTLKCFITFELLWAGVGLPPHPQPRSQLPLSSDYLNIFNGRRQKVSAPRQRPPHISLIQQQWEFVNNFQRAEDFVSLS